MGNKCLSIITIAFFISCTYTKVPNYLKEQFKYSPAEHKVISKEVNINGFYRDFVQLNSTPASIPCGSFYLTSLDTSIKENMAVLDLMFFPNGLCLSAYLSKLNRKLDSVEYNRIKSEMKRLNKPGYVMSLIGENWGTYQIINDTIKIKVISRGSLMASSVGAYEKWYRIIDNTTLEPLYCKGLSKDNCQDFSNCAFKLDSTFCSKSRFYELQDVYVDPDYSWLINKKWFWKNKEEYKAWKKNKRP